MQNLTAFLRPALTVGIPALLMGTVLFPSTIVQAYDYGRDGRSGTSQTIFLKPNGPQTLLRYDLSGSDGADGKSYGKGYSYDDRDDHQTSGSYRRTDCDQTSVGGASDVTMPSGADGPRGGAGGNGGNGGSLTVYYQNLSDLQTILVNAQPGRGGQGGAGGRGQRGCKCPKSEWKVGDKTYKCTHGSRGSHGSSGASGQSGQMGKLFLIRGAQTIAGDNPQSRQVLNQLIQNPYALTLNRWDARNGALRLLASGSTIDDTYREYRDRLEKTVKVNWNAKSNLQEYSSQYATINLQNSGAIAVEFDDKQLWTIVEQSEVNSKPTEKPITQVTIKSMIHQREVTQLTPGLSDKRNRDFTLNLIDTAGKSDLLDTQFSVRVRSMGQGGRLGSFGPGTTEYEGVIPANLVMRDYNRFVLNLGGLPIDAEVFRSGVELDVEITATRSLGTRSAQQKIDWSGTVY